MDKSALEQRAIALQQAKTDEEEGKSSTRGNVMNIHRSITKEGETPSAADEFHNNFVDDYLPDELKEKFITKVDRDKFRNEIIKYGKRAKYKIGRICQPETCPEADSHECPFVNMGDEFVPRGKRCPLEMMEIDGLITEFEKMFVNEFNIDESLVQLHVKDLVVIEINLNRIDSEIAKRGVLEGSPIFAMPKSETIVEGLVGSPLFVIQETLIKRRERILKSLLITPEAKARYKMRQEKDLATLVAELKRRAQESIIRHDAEIEEGQEKKSLVYSVTDQEQPVEEQQQNDQS